MTSPSFTSAMLSRRAALLATGAGAALALSACAQSVRPLADSSESASTGVSGSASAGTSASASASSSPSSTRSSYKGDVQFDNYEKSGTYVPASASAKAQNVPKPLAPANMNERSTEGIYAFAGYWLASLNYLILTGDTEPMKKADGDNVYVKQFQTYSDVYASGLGWMYGSDQPLTISLISDAPVQDSKNPARYNWLARMKFDSKLMMHAEGQADEPFEADSEKSKNPLGSIMNMAVEYKDGGWIMLTGNEDKTAAANSSAV